MLFVLFGTTVEMGYRSREYFIRRGFELIKKKYYIPDDNVLQERFGERLRVSGEEVEQCDFVYENNGMVIGFNKEQIIDSVRGRKNCILTLSSYSIDFIRQIKVAYGDYVTVIGAYIDDVQLNKMFTSLSDVSQKEVAVRMNTGKRIKQILLNERNLFDDVVIYGGEDSLFDFQSLHTQYDFIVEKALKKERLLNDKMYVEMPYSGSSDYVFVSYAHEDWEKVFPILSKLQRAGCRIWYDEGIQGGDNWFKILASKIESQACVNFFLFSSCNSVHSKYVKSEIYAAVKCDKKIVTIQLDDSEFDLEYDMYIGIYQKLFTTDSNFDSKIISAVNESARVAEQK